MPAFCKDKSKIRMAIMLKNGNDHLKLISGTGNLINPCWYSFLKNDKKSDQVNIAKMIEKFKESRYFGNANLIIFYRNPRSNIKLHIERF